MSIDIVCTIGPASMTPVVIEKMIHSGMTIARLNMSHGNHADYQETIRYIRETAKRARRDVKILADLQGPKIRLGEFLEEKIKVEEGQSYELVTETIVGDRSKAQVDYPGIINDVKVGAEVLINDGEVRMRVTEIYENRLKTLVIVGGNIGSNKGVNFPGTKLSVPAITDKDREDLVFLIQEKVDQIACSFVRRAFHVEDIRLICSKSTDNVPELIAKIETVEAIANFQDIAAHSDGVMIARGDLGVELPLEHIPFVQKAILKECKKTNKFVITATQMLHSMIHSPVPTRAEVSDIFQAVIDGTNAVMLSGESSVGQFPVIAVETLKRVAEYAEEIMRSGSLCSLEDYYADFLRL